MQSSPDPEIFDDHEMFPGEDRPTTPSNRSQGIFSQAVSELSPPNSQGQTTSTRAEAPPSGQYSATMSSDLNSNGKRTLTGARRSFMSTSFGESRQNGHSASAGFEWEQSQEPGWAWKNKKAQDEYARAMEQIIDKGQMIGSEWRQPARDITYH